MGRDGVGVEGPHESENNICVNIYLCLFPLTVVNSKLKWGWSAL